MEVRENGHGDWFCAEYNLGKKIIKMGKGLQSPNDNSKCQVKVTHKNMSPDSEVPLDFPFDEVATIVVNELDTALGRLVSMVLYTMKEDEICDIACSMNAALAECDVDEIPSDEQFEFSLHLMNFEEKPEEFELDDLARFERAIHHKEKGVELFRQGRTRSAFYRFSRAFKCICLIDQAAASSPVRFENCGSLVLSLRLNMAACQLQTGKYECVVSNCSRVLDSDAKNLKALYRRGSAFVHLQEYDKAKVDLDRLNALDPGNKAAKQQMKILIDKVRDDNIKLAKQMRKMFNR